jgi:hypothetical protein
MKLTALQKKVLLSILSNTLGKTSKEIIEDIYGPNMYYWRKSTVRVSLCSIRKWLKLMGYEMITDQPYIKKFVGRGRNADKERRYRFDQSTSNLIRKALG